VTVEHAAAHVRVQRGGFDPQPPGGLRRANPLFQWVTPSR
jgi:hypothetical protein